MKLADHRSFDALCGEYLLGALRGAARRRFERALREEPRAATRLAHWQMLLPRYSHMIEESPSTQVWSRLQRSLGLERYRTPWHQRIGLWRGWAAAATAVLILALAIPFIQKTEKEIALLAGKESSVTASLSRDGRTLALSSARPIVAGPQQSYELWVIPEGGKPVSVAVLGNLDARFTVAAGQAALLRSGATLAVSAEPVGGSPTGQPTGPVILAGKITL